MTAAFDQLHRPGTYGRTRCLRSLVREWLCAHGKATGRGLHQATIRLVCAESQAEKAKSILPLLTEEEAAVFKRGRNAQVHTVPAMPAVRSIVRLQPWRRFLAGCI